MLDTIINDKIMLLNTSTFIISLTELDMILKLVFYTLSIFYTFMMIYKKWREIKSTGDKCAQHADNQDPDN